MANTRIKVSVTGVMADTLKEAEEKIELKGEEIFGDEVFEVIDIVATETEEGLCWEATLHSGKHQSQSFFPNIGPIAQPNESRDSREKTGFEKLQEDFLKRRGAFKDVEEEPS